MIVGLEKAGVRRGERWIFRNLSFSLQKGSCLAVLGPNGRGKTTLIKALAGLLTLDEGARIAPPAIGYVAQHQPGDIPYRVLDVVVMGRARSLSLFGSPGKADYRIAEKMLERVGMSGFAERMLDTLSGGERQIVALARAMATEAPVLILDEPASALDLANQSVLLRTLREVSAQKEHAILFSTHQPQHVLAVADEAMLMVDAARVIHGEASDVMTEDNLRNLYGVDIRRLTVTDSAGVPFEAIAPQFMSGMATSAIAGRPAESPD